MTANPCSRTYFVSGFDPRGAAHYLALFQAELKVRGYRTGKRITNDLITRWPLRKAEETRNNSKIGKSSSSELSFLHWDDIARANWPRHPLEILRQVLSYASFYFFKGKFLKVARLCPGVALCGAYPLLFGCLALTCSLTTALILLEMMHRLDLEAGYQFIALGIGLLTLFSAWKLAEKIGLIWLTRSILFTHRLGQAKEKDLRKRISKLADELIKIEKDNPAQRILIIGHSSGSFVLAMLAAQLKRNEKAKAILARIELLTLGQNLTNLSIYPEAKPFREDLKLLADEPRLPWRDVTSEQDLLCFAGVNPFTSCGITLPKGQSYPKMEIISLKSPAKNHPNKNILLNQFKIHFDYLRNHCSSVDLPGLLTNSVNKSIQ